MKPIIRKQGDCWTVTRPAFGFASESIACYPTWRAAMASLPAPGSAGPITERGASEMRWQGMTRGPVTIRMEAP